RERVAARFFPRHSKPDAELQRTMAQLMQIVRQFITFRYSNVHKGKTAAASSTKDPAENPFLLLNNARQQLALIRFYSERLYQNPSASLLLDPGGRKDRDGQEARKSRRLENLFENLYKDTKRTLHASEQFDGYNEYIFNDLYYFRYLLEQEKALYVSLYDQRAGDKNLLVAMEALDQYYLISKLDLMAKLIHFQRMSDLYLGSTEENERLKTNKLFTQQLVQTLIDSGYLQTPVLQLYCILLQLITLDDPIEAEKVYDLFCQLLDQNGKAIPARRMTDLKVMLRSFWPSRYRETKDRRFLERLHHMHCEHLDMAPEGQEIPGSHFFNIIVTAVKLDKLDWAEDFFQAYQPRIF
ncbi:MAG: hypothetical protein IT260_08675, partial [Saprospiraceae bacterium]|nr:hypothetical protein [Saprospiraceae bacterium]